MGQVCYHNLVPERILIERMLFVDYTVAGKSYDADSVVNQRIKQTFVARNVLANITDFAENLFSWNGCCYDVWDNWYNICVIRCPECGNFVDEWDEPDDEDGDVYKETAVECPYCGQILGEEPEPEYHEILEHWIVSPWFGEKLKARGEPVYQRSSGWIWGRCCSGQAIFLDGVISEICIDLEILEGQARDWSKEGVLS